MVFGLKIYTVHLLPTQPRASQQPVFIREGFNIFAFIFTGLWALFHRLWLAAFLILAFNVALVFLGRAHVLNSEAISIIQLAFQFLIGYQANDLRRAKLARDGYIFADVTASDSFLRAQQRYFERLAVA